MLFLYVHVFSSCARYLRLIGKVNVKIQHSLSNWYIDICTFYVFANNS